MRTSDAFDERITTYGRLREAHQRLDAAFAPSYERHGLSTTWFEAMLRIKLSQGERLRMCDLAEQVAVTTGGATRLVDGLIQEGLVERRSDLTDRRVQLVALTATGSARLDEAVATHLEELETELFARLSGDDVAHLDRILDLLREPTPPQNTSSEPRRHSRTRRASSGR